MQNKSTPIFFCRNITLRISLLIFFLLLSFFSRVTIAQESIILNKKQINTSGVSYMEWLVNGVARKALVYIPATAQTQATPILFVYHGHGGNMENMFKTRGFDKLWPEAIFICPQGLNTPGTLLDRDGKEPGWLMNADDDNRDLQFFDAMYSTLIKDYKVDKKRVFITGHSNGGGFSYLLMAKRGDSIAAIAPSASTGAKLFGLLRPKPVFHIMGENDDLVKPEWQRLTINKVLRLNDCKPNGEKVAEYSTLYASANGNPVQLMIHPGGHKYPLEANPLIINFFKKIN